MEETIDIPAGVESHFDGKLLTLKGKHGTSKKIFDNPFAKLELHGNIAKVTSGSDKRKEKRVVNTFAAHVRSMVKGVTQGYVYELEIAQSHFPVKITQKGNKVLIENFAGEKNRREAEIRHGVSMKIEGKVIRLSGADKEDVGQAASALEMATRLRHKDRRTFQDGIFIMKKEMTIDG